MVILIREVEWFVEDKKLEIEIFIDRENYWKEFMGNVFYELKMFFFIV